MEEKTTDRVSGYLKLAADMESFSPLGDSLSDWVDRYSDDELTEDELTFVSAAGGAQSYAAFRKKFGLE